MVLGTSWQPSRAAKIFFRERTSEFVCKLCFKEIEMNKLGRSICRDNMLDWHPGCSLYTVVLAEVARVIQRT